MTAPLGRRDGASHDTFKLDHAVSSLARRHLLCIRRRRLASTACFKNRPNTRELHHGAGRAIVTDMWAEQTLRTVNPGEPVDFTFGSLFAGVGGFDLGLERAGMRCRWQVEIDPYARRVLERHWPDVPRWDDVRTFPPDGDFPCTTDTNGRSAGFSATSSSGSCGADGAESRCGNARESWRVDLICGGFPCQDISNAGRRAGIDGERSGLWSEFARIVGLLRPRYVLLENVAALLGRGMGRVLGDLSTLGYDAEWDVIPACAVGAPHIRERVWIVAHAVRPGLAFRPCLGGDARQELAALERSGREAGGQWATEPGIRRVADRVPDRVDRLRCLGNSLLPQIAEFIGRRILESERSLT